MEELSLDVTSHNTIMTMLTSSGPVLSYPHTIHSKPHHTHTNLITPTQTSSHPHKPHHTHTTLITPTQTSSHPHKPHHTHTNLITPTQTSSHPHKPHHTHVHHAMLT